MDKIDLKLLIVDDEKVVTDSLQLTYEKMFTEVYSCHNGIEAINILEARDIDVVVTDLNMPDMCGVDLIDWIAMHKEIFVPIIITSGHHDIAEKYLDSGCITIHNKPIDIRDLTKEILHLGTIKKEMCKTKENLAKIENIYKEAKALLDKVRGK